MATCGSDFLEADDFDVVMAKIDADMLSEVNSAVQNLPSGKNSGQHHCRVCSKNCLSESGLLTHVKLKHPENLSSNEESNKLKYSIDLFLLKTFNQDSAAKLAEDACYSEDVMGKFKNFKISSAGDILPAYNLMLPIIKSFNGDPEKSYPQYCKAFISTEKLYKNLSSNYSLLLSFEVANHVSAQLTGAIIQEDVLTYKIEEAENFSENDLSLISYLRGYVFGTFYRKICCSTKNAGLYSQQCFSFLMARKFFDKNVTLPEHKHVNIMDRGGLWNVNENVTSIFKIAERYFRTATQKHVIKIDSNSIVSNLMANATVLHHATVLKSKSEETIKKEVALNLLEDLLTLYIRVRSLSFANDKQQAYKIQQTE